MMERQYDWSPLGESRDPIPGSPDQVRQAALHYRTISSQLAEAAGSIRSVTFEGEGETIQVLRTRTQELSKNLDGVKDLCGNASHALEGYSGALGEAQELSVKALRMAEQGRHEYQVQSMNREDVRRRYNNSKDENERANLQHSFYAYDAQMKQASDSIKAAKQLLNQAIEHRDAAATHTAGALGSLIDESPVKDTWVDKFFKFVDDHSELIETVSNVLDVISTVASIADAVLTVAFPPAAPVAKAIAIATGAAALGLNLIHNMNEVRNGRMTREEATIDSGVDAAFFGASLLPGGKVVGKIGSKIFKKGAKEVAKETGEQAVKQTAKKGSVKTMIKDIAKEVSGIGDYVAENVKAWLGNREPKDWWSEFTLPGSLGVPKPQIMTPARVPRDKVPSSLY